jgi:hypothetical protein
VTKLDTTGSALIYSTYLGGKDRDVGNGIAVDPSGNAYVVGDTNSVDFPTTTGAFDTTCGTTNGPCSINNGDIFITRLNATGSALVYSTYLGGTGGRGDPPMSAESGKGITVDAEGNAYVTGTTDATDFPVTIGALDTGCGTDGFCKNDSFGGISDVFVTKLNPTGSALVYSTFLGGSDADYGNSIAVDVSGNVYITGTTFSKDFPTVNPLQPAKGGDICDGIPCSDAFVAKLNPTGSALIYSTYLGGGPNMNGFGGFDQGLSIAVDTLGNTYVTGSTNSDSFPIVNSLQSFKGSGTCGGIPCSDAFVAKLNPTGSSLVYSIYLGGNGDDFGFGIAMDTSGNAYITSKTVSANFPHTAGAFNTSCGTDGLCHSSNNFTDVTSDVFITNIAPGLSVPLTDAVDYNGDGKADFTVYRPSTGQWFVFGAADSTSFGSVNDIPTPGDYNGDGVPDFAFFRPSTGQWPPLKHRNGSELRSNRGYSGS